VADEKNEKDSDKETAKAKAVSRAKRTVRTRRAASPAKRSEKLTADEKRFPELQDPAWVEGNKDAAKKMES
jgi:hypothetical protein